MTDRQLDPIYSLNKDTGYWSRSGYQSINYSDGKETENRIRRLIHSSKDRSVLSDELRSKCTDWPSAYHLSATRTNILRPFSKALKNASVLEIGAGCGAITRFLGECEANVIALEGSTTRAEIARVRTEGLLNVHILAETFNDFESSKKFDCITLIGVLEYANLFMPGENPFAKMLEKAANLLNPSGMLILAIENQLGLKYFAGAPEDHVWKSMYGIEGRYKRTDPQTFGEVELTELLENAGLLHLEKFAPFPDYKFPYAIITECGSKKGKFDAGTLASQHSHRDQQLPHELNFSPELAWPEIARNDLLISLSNSFLFVAKKNQEAAIKEEILGYNYSTERKSVYCKEAIFTSSHDGEIVVNIRRLSEGSERESSAINWIQPKENFTPYFAGNTLQSLISKKWKHDQWNDVDIKPLLELHLAAILDQAEKNDDQASLTLGTALPGKLIDLTLSNAIYDGKRVNAFDLEWALKDTFPLGWLLFRSYLILIQSTSRIGKPAGLENPTRMSLIKRLFSTVGFDITESILSDYARREAIFQHEVTLRISTDELNWEPAAPVPVSHVQDLLWHAKEDAKHLLQAKTEIQTRLEETSVSLARRTAELEETSVSLVWRTAELEHQKSINTALQEDSAQLRVQVDRQEAAARQAIAQTQILMQEWLQKHFKKTNHRHNGGKAFDFVARKLMGRKSESDRSIEKLLRSTAFDSEFYLASNRDLNFKTRREAASHFHLHGWVENRNPCKWFVCYDYLLANPDVLISGCNPFLHYLEFGNLENRKLGLQAHRIESRNADFPSYKVVPVYLDPFSSKRLNKTVTNCSLRIYVEECSTKDFFTASKIEDCCVRLGIDCSVSIPPNGPKPPVMKTNWEFRDHATSQWTDFFNYFSDVDKIFEVIGSIGTAGHPQATQTTDVLPETELDQAIEQSVLMTLQQCSLLRTGLPFHTFCNAEDMGISEEEISAAYNKSIGDEEKSKVSRDLALGTSFFANGHFHRYFLQRQIELANISGALSSQAQYTYLTTARSEGFCSSYVAQPEIASRSHWYESKSDFAELEKKFDTRVLAFYLPQFHPTPENDEWHGKGFTEWYKVRTAAPLFEGHYQQHIPHSDIGYYHIDDISILQKQAAMLKAGGLSGLVFYHYWFTGRLILEKPAQMLLEHPNVDLPFCFCWANENWTRRWDGEDQDVLLAQNYSNDDALAFIKYLIPFFKDSRYIKVNDRPVLMVYRPSSITIPETYIQIWKDHCQECGIPAPYVVATLTRGATSPEPFGMDAALERPLNDWTDGAVPDIRSKLSAYKKMTGSALDYSAVAKYYAGKKGGESFTYIRSVVPVWDNTPRYKDAAYLLHNFSSFEFQSWVTAALEDTEHRLHGDEKILVVNAWNEWGEGAHLEPDEWAGYAYLNCIGRAIAGIPYFPKWDGSLRSAVLTLSHHALQRIHSEKCTKLVFVNGLLSQSENVLISVHKTDTETIRFLSEALVKFEVHDSALPDSIEITIDDPMLLLEDTFAQLIECALRHKGYRIIANHKNDRHFFGKLEDNFLPDPSVFKAGLSARTIGDISIGNKIAASSHCYRLEREVGREENMSLAKVSVLVRFHEGAAVSELRNAVCSLLAQTNVQLEILLLAQGGPSDRLRQLFEQLEALPRAHLHHFRMEYFEPSVVINDMRSTMLNKGLNLAQNDFVVILDYDDTIFPGSYSYLVENLASSGKIASFGRVYHASIDDEHHLIENRREHTAYGASYEAFFENNCAPIHSFMIDKSRIAISDLEYFPDMKYMEDYYLLLQIFDKDNCDWNSLISPTFIGDYNFRKSGKNHTLGIQDAESISEILLNNHYILCDNRINILRRKISYGKLAKICGYEKAPIFIKNG